VRRLLLAPLLLAAAGCAALPTIGDGIHVLIYQHTTTPLDLNARSTPAFVARDEEGAGDVKHISVRQFPVYIDVMWDSNAIGDIARQEGIEEVHYADVERLSILRIWNQTTVHIYGRPAASR